MVLALKVFPLNAKQIHRERSLYRNVVITENKNLRCMRFETRRKRVSNQACVDKNAPQKLVFEYAHGVMAALSREPKPERILVIGLGGGSLQMALHALLPQAEIVSVEIDPVVYKLAKQYFAYTDGGKLKTVIQDGRVFVKREALKNAQYDWIILDAFNGDYIPEHLMTREFLQEVSQILSPSGMVIANTFSTSKLYDYETATYASVFKTLVEYQTPTKGNRLLFACQCEALEFSHGSKSLADQLAKMGINLQQVIARLNPAPQWRQDVRVLTDQYSPVNLLKQQ